MKIHGWFLNESFDELLEESLKIFRKNLIIDVLRNSLRKCKNSNGAAWNLTEQGTLHVEYKQGEIVDSPLSGEQTLSGRSQVRGIGMSLLCLLNTEDLPEV